MNTCAPDLTEVIDQAIRSVDDPEYPGVSIVDLGLLESLDVSPDEDTVAIGLIPTFSGCPALEIIAEDVRAAVAAVAPECHVTVSWLRSPVWSTDRISADAATALADRFTVAVQIGSSAATCPRCGEPTTQQSMFGPSRCRAVHRCPGCGEAIEVMRG
jgi:ring-1,2-phenylacetyl-CoA epoxidase subunit PaaD